MFDSQEGITMSKDIEHRWEWIEDEENLLMCENCGKVIEDSDRENHVGEVCKP